MAARLSITEIGEPGSEYVRSFLQDRIVIGRARSADVCLPDMAVSTRHAEIRLRGNDYVAVDLGSLNGTEVSGTELVAHRPRALQNGDTIVISSFRITFGLGATSGPVEPRDASLRQARDMLSRVLARSGVEEPSPVLVVVAGPGKASRFELPPPPAKLVIGRGDEASISLEDRDVSRRHAEVVVEPEGVFIRDLSSRNGLHVDGEQVEASRLEQGTHFKLGKTTMALEHSAERSLSAIFEAPEEETSSFALDQQIESSPRAESTSEKENAARLSSRDDPEPTGESAPPPIGPADPLIDAARAPLSRTTGHIPRPEIQDKSDWGLIVVGAIILVAAVVGLVYLFS